LLCLLGSRSFRVRFVRGEVGVRSEECPPPGQATLWADVERPAAER
jgi:hypothetical protein